MVSEISVYGFKLTYNLLTEHHRSNRDEYLLNLTRDNTQLLLNEIWELPTERVEETVVAKLPAPKYKIPRSRRIPVPKPLTKWQKFAQDKGIKKKKRDKKVYDKDMDVSENDKAILK